MLKVNFDEGQDHIAMFEPFARDAVAALESDDMDVSDVNAAVLKRHELELPVNTMRTLLGRLVRQGFLRREGGRYFRTDREIDSEDVVRKRRSAERRQRRLADGLIASAAKSGVRIESSEEALALIMGFMESYHVKLAFDEPPEVDSSDLEDAPKSPERVATALFLREAITAESEQSDVLQEMLEGFVLQNTLLLKDIATAGRQFQNLQVIADSQILFGSLGLLGPTTQTATLELFDLLKETGASINVFAPTIREMRGILSIYEGRIGSKEGRESLRQTDLTRYFLSAGAAPSDIREHAALIEARIKSLGVTMRSLPDRRPEWMLSEEALGKALSEQSGEERGPRVLHDIDCVSATLMYRRGKVSDSLDTVSAVFVTTSGVIVKNTQRWYREQGGKGFPPIVHSLSLSNYAWLKRPESAAKLKAHELVALCTAALRPSRTSWERFLHHLRDLEKSGELSSDEVTAVVASELTMNVLAEEGIDEDSDAASLSEVVARVKSTYEKSADSAVTAANEKAAQKAAEARGLRAGIRRRAEGVAGALSLLAAVVLVASLVLGTVVSLVDAVTGEPASWVALVLALAPLAVLGLLGVIWGFHVKGWRNNAKERLANWLERWMLQGYGSAPEPLGDGDEG